MTIPTQAVRQRLRTFDFRNLFIEELGWDTYSDNLPIEVDGRAITLEGIAQKRGLGVFKCPAIDGMIPDYALRKKIERQLAKVVREHLIIFVDPSQTEQVWQWMRREPGRPLASREMRYSVSQSGEPLIQRLQTIAFSLEEEENITILDATSRVRAAFDVERVTRQFYEIFKDEHKKFLDFLSGIPDEEMERWYVSVMLNRLMFIYFIQKKGFLKSNPKDQTGDPNYLKAKLGEMKQIGEDRYYRDFLCPLFFKGFASKERDAETLRLLGDIPYLNGGLFLRHQIEELYGQQIQIPDRAFERLFAFFDRYHWHLDERPLRDDREINPDVLGYIFEKYINQKQMGAYYTKEDITEYISKNTIIPFLFYEARKECHIAFEGEHSIWGLLQETPERYIYPAVRHGMEYALPEEIAAGIEDVSERGLWNTPAPPEYGLPTEIWREVVSRRQRCEEVWQKLVNGEICEVNELITYNLDIQQFAQDVIENAEGPELLRAFWKAINQVTVLDPTCGSGAFLFAALSILEPVYDACLERMQSFVNELATSEDHHPQKYSDFRRELSRVAQHPNHRYFTLKSIIVNNLYGVDIMEEAVEIAKLRLFLKLVAQIDPAEHRIEPLPDIDFNIRSGNVLVGYATKDAVQTAMRITVAGQGKLVFGEDQAALDAIERRAQDVDRLFGLFRQQQTELGGEVHSEDKAELLSRLQILNEELNQLLARQYGIDPAKEIQFTRWLKSHQPFHWFVQFYGVLKKGGFDVIIGNPPYVEYSQVRKVYTVQQYETLNTGNLFSFVMERSISISSNSGQVGLIVQLSGFATPRMEALNQLVSRSGKNHISFYECRPGKLFDGIDVRLAMWLCSRNQSSQTWSTKLYRFPTEFRPFLLNNLSYINTSSHVISHVTPKLSTAIEHSVYEKLAQKVPVIGAIRKQDGNHKAYYSYGVRYWARVLNSKPYYLSDTTDVSTGEKTLAFDDTQIRDAIVCIMTSSLFFWYYCVVSDGHNFTKTVIDSFPVGELSAKTINKLSNLCIRLMSELDSTAAIRRAYYKTTGNVEYKEYRVSATKQTIDEIDRVLGQHYGFTDDEIDFIINYDIKYRMGDDLHE